jgi:hypothetical protein
VKAVTIKARVYLHSSQTVTPVDIGVIEVAPIAPATRLAPRAEVKLTWLGKVDVGRIWRIDPDDWENNGRVPVIVVLQDTHT